MNITTVLFDLDGTLLPMDQDVFVGAYFKGLAASLAPHGYEPKALIDAVWAGTKAMILNNGKKTNEAAFWDVFAGIFGENARKDEPFFDAFYQTDFDRVKEVCGFNPDAAKAVHAIKDAGLQVALATNPIFPAIATEKRISWAGLDPADFALYTTYENAGYSKPSIGYYQEIIDRLGIAPEECLMVGNDVTDDMVAKQLGMQVFLLTDYLINKDEADISVYPHGGFTDLLQFLGL